MLFSHFNNKLMSETGVVVLKDAFGLFVHCDSKKAELLSK